MAYLIGLFAFLATLAGLLWKAFSAGKTSEQSKQDRQRIETMRQAKEIENEVGNLGSNDVDQYLAKWMRDKQE